MGSYWLDPTGKTTFGIGICGRCSKKFFLEELEPDPNSPALMVCREDKDVYDPYRLPSRPEDQISLPFVRPDTNIDVTDADTTTSTGTTYTFWATDFWATDFWATDFWA
jgi:hypothetical protein